jgi:hypothetical protein
VEFRLHRPRPEDSDRFGQESIHTAHPGGFRPDGAGIEVRDLRRRMHAAVGTARARDADHFDRDRGERLLEDILDCAAARLSLPAQKAAAVVLQS